jgi:hypothetical protein
MATVNRITTSRHLSLYMSNEGMVYEGARSSSTSSIRFFLHCDVVPLYTQNLAPRNNVYICAAILRSL